MSPDVAALRVLLLGMEEFNVRPSGLNRYLKELAKALNKAGTPTDIVVLKSRESRVDGRKPDLIVEAPLLQRVISFWRAARLVAARAEVVDIHFALYSLLPVMTTLRLKPTVVHFQGPWGSESAVERREHALKLSAKRFIERVVYHRAAFVIVLSRAFRQLVIDDYHIPPERVVVIPPGVDLERFTPGARIAAREALGLPLSAGFVCVAARRLTPRMGLDVLLRAWHKVAIEPKHLLLAGTGPDRGRLESITQRLGLGSSVSFLGRVSDDDLQYLYRAADVSVMPSISFEGFGLAALESLACGTPVIVSDADGLPEAVARIDPSLVVPVGDEEALAARLLAAYQGRVPTAEMCRKHAETFNWGGVADLHLAVYRAAWRGRRLGSATHISEGI
jgi:glycosyltransferase involved in cell wall biosynthesis